MLLFFLLWRGICGKISTMEKYITNDEFREGCRCPKLFWLERNNSCAVQVSSDALSEVARNYIKGGRYVKDDTPEKMAAVTARLISAGQRIIKNPAFLVAGTFCRADIIRFDKTGVATIYFSRSALHVRRVFCKEAALLFAAAEEIGLEKIRVVILLPNKNYIRCGEIDARQFLSACDLSEDARQLKDKAISRANALCSIARWGEEPEIDIHSGCFSPDGCKYFGHCTAHLPQPNVFRIARLNQNTKLKLYNDGIYSYEALKDHPALTDSQKKQVRLSLSEAEPQVKKKELGEFLSSLWYPMCFLDFESWQPAVPPTDMMKAFEQVPFQYSLHIVEREGAEVMHKEFLANGKADPRCELAHQLAKDVPDGACVVVYNKQFEKMVIADLSRLCPDISEKLTKISEGICDLMIPFQKKLYYDRRMEGSFSMKAVLPAMFPDTPELCYENLCGVHNGSQAMQVYAKMSGMSEEEAAEARANLLKYCGLDTYGMVKILEKLRLSVK